MRTFTLLLTFTRSAWLGWIAAVAVLLILKWPRALAWAVPVAISGAQFRAAAALQPADLELRHAAVVEPRSDPDGRGRRGDHQRLPAPRRRAGERQRVYPLYRKHDAPRFRIPHLHNNVIQLWAERGVLALVAYLFLLGPLLRECARGWGGTVARVRRDRVAVAVALAAAGLFEFNFGDTEVFWILLDLFALVDRFIERPELPNELRLPRGSAASRSVTFLHGSRRMNEIGR